MCVPVGAWVAIVGALTVASNGLVAQSMPTAKYRKFDSKIRLAVHVPRGDGTYEVAYTPSADGAGIRVPERSLWYVRPAQPDEQQRGVLHRYEAFRGADLPALVDEIVKCRVPGLSLYRCSRIADDDIEAIGRAAHLRFLDLSAPMGCGPQLTDRVFRTIGVLANAEDLSLQGQKDVTGAGVSLLAGCAKLRRLNLSGTGVGDSAIEQFPTMGELRALSLASSAVTGSTTAGLARCTVLGYLDLSGTKLGDEGFVRCVGLPHIEAMALGECREVSDIGLSGVTMSSSLKVLWLRGAVGNADLPRVTAGGIAALRERMRKTCVVVTTADEKTCSAVWGDRAAWWAAALE